MNFKQEILDALQSGKDYRALLDIVRRHMNQGLTSETSYEVLEEIWRELGFDEMAETSALREDLEFAMEKIWYQGTSA